MHLILAGSYRQYNAFLSKHRLNPQFFKYVGEPEDLLGVSNPKIIRVGTWWEHPALDKFDELVVCGRITTVLEGVL